MTQNKKGRLAPFTYAKAGGPPMDWANYMVWLDDEMVDNVIEVDTEEGWAHIMIVDENSGARIDIDTGSIYCERIEGNFELRREAK